MNFFKTKMEKDFEFFVGNIGKLQPAEFLGLAKVMSVSALRGPEEIGMRAEDLKGKSEEETREIIEKLTIPTDQILERMMDKFLGMSKKARGTVIQLMKDVQRGR